jgi:hypothetical protein
VKVKKRSERKRSESDLDLSNRIKTWNAKYWKYKNNFLIMRKNLLVDTIRREDLTAESAGINPEGQELAYEQGDLLDEYVGEHSMKMLTSVMDIIVEDALKRGISQKGILAFFQWNINTMWRYVDLHDHQSRGEVTMEPVGLSGNNVTVSYHCGTAECDPPKEEE